MKTEEKAFFDLLDKACTTIVEPEKPVRKPREKITDRNPKSSK